jgi:hypothetical protein
MTIREELNMERKSDIGTDKFFEEAARETLFEGIRMSSSNSDYTDRLKEIGERAVKAAERLNADLHDNKRYFQFAERNVRDGVEKLAEKLEAVANVTNVRIRYGKRDIDSVMRALTSRYSMREIERAYKERDQPKDRYGDSALKEAVAAYGEYIKNKDRFNRGRNGKPLGSRDYLEIVAREIFDSRYASDFVRSDDWGKAIKDQISKLVDNITRRVQRARNFCEFADRDQRGRVVRVIKSLGVSDYLASNVECELKQVKECESAKDNRDMRKVELLTTAQVSAIAGGNRSIRELIDLDTGKSFNISWAASAGYHTDWDPATLADTSVAQSLSTWGSWRARPGIIIVDNRLIAVGFHLMPHGVSFTANNGINGHMCMYYHDSPTGTGTAEYAASMNAAAEEAYNMSR